MATSDVRDILDVKREAPSKPAKKPKTTQRRPEHIPRELFELIGERAPPVAAQEIQYKTRPKWPHKVLPWELSAFTNPARKDGLVLRHWRKRKPLGEVTPSPATPADADPNSVSTSKQDDKTRLPQTEYHFAKFNVKVNGPEYTDEEYNDHLKSEDWSKDETDYLVNLALDYDLRWIVIADRYDFHPKELPVDGEAMAISIPAKERTMEDMKVRYYNVAAKIMAFHHPLSSMSTSEFDLHEKMTKFNPNQETTRKKLAEALLSRSPEEIREEEILLGELKRIVTNEERFSQERKDLYARLEAPPSTGNTAIYQSSQGLGQLMQTLLSADKSKKRRSLMGPHDASESAGVSSSHPSTNPDRSHRNSYPNTSAIKKSSLSLGSNQRPLTPREEAKYGISHHERLAPGVSFRTARIDKLIAAKSTIQSAKITAALTELSIPPKLVMPTAKVCVEFEKLVGGIQTLLDVRKVSEKVEGEIRVLRAQREERERGNSRGEREVKGNRQDVEEDEGGEGQDGGDVEMEDEGKASEDEAKDSEVEAKASDDEDKGSDEEDEEEGDEEAEVEGEDENIPAEENDGGDDDGDEDGDGDGDGDGDVVDEERASVAPSVKSSAVKRSASVLSATSQKSSKRQRK